VVRQGETAPLNVAWSVEAAGAETVSVVEPRPITRPDTAQTGTVLSSDTLNRIPTGRSYQGAAQLVPGVSGGANPNIKGGLLIQNRYLIDGLDITDPVTGTFSTNLNFDSIGSVQVITGGMPAEYNSLGGVINVITLAGSDELHASASIYANHHKLSASDNYGPNLYDGRQPWNEAEVGPTQSYQVSVNVGGPVVRKRLWYNATYELRLAESSALRGPPLGAPPYNIQHPSSTSQVHLMRLKLTYLPSAAHRLTLSANADPGFFNNDGAGEKNSYLGVAERRQNQGGVFAIAGWEWFLRPGLTTALQAGFQASNIEGGPQGRLGTIGTAGCEQFTRMDNCTYDPNRPRHINLVDNTAWYQGTSYQDDSRYTVQIDPSVSVRGTALGFHDAKAGVQSRLNHRTRYAEIPAGSVFRDRTDPPLPLEAGLCDPKTGVGCYRRVDTPPFDVAESAYGVGLYVQDRWWTPARWLTVEPGLRFDYGHTEDRKGRTVSDLWGLGPRLGLIADVTQDARTIVSVYYGRSNEVLSLLPASNIDAVEASVSTEWEWDPMTSDFTRLVRRSGGEGGLIVDDDLTTPHTDEVTVSARRQVFTSTVAGVEYTYKRISNIWDAIEVNQIWDPTGSRVVGWVDPAKPDQEVYLFTTPDENHRTYQGIDLIIEGRPSPSWDLAGGYTLSWTYGPGVTEFGQISSISQGDNPRNRRYFDGFLPEDARHRFRSYAAYRWRRLNLGGYLVYTTGGPLTKVYWSPQAGGYARYRSPFGTEPGDGNNPDRSPSSASPIASRSTSASP
jgi:hypothetical protein